MNDVDIQLTKSQAELHPKMQSFLNGSDRIFLLTGKPGVGKTFVLQYLLAEHIEADRNGTNQGFSGMNVAGITLAHSAKNVLGEFIPNVFTFAKAYGMEEVINQRTGERSFAYAKFNDGPLVGTMSIPVFVFDEVSMFTKEMLEIVINNAPIFSKIIFIGDKAQLPPIDKNGEIDADSPVFTYDIPEHCKHELTERVRQVAGNSILELSDIIREQIFGEQNIQVVLDAIRQPNMTDGIGYSFVRYHDILKHISEKDIMTTRLIAYRNKTIDKWNPYIRDYLLRNPHHKLVPGDVVIMKDNFYKIVDDKVEYILFNSELLRIGEVQNFVVRFNQGDISYKIDAYRAHIEGRPNQYLISTTPEGEMVYQTALFELSQKAKKAAPSSRRFLWEAFWNLKKTFCNYSYGYASTAYKAQGSSYTSVYLDINDILNTGPLTPKRKLQTIYTGITRARQDVYFLKG